MSKHFKNDDHVNWKSHGTVVQGHVVSRQTHDTKIKGDQVRASGHEPQYIVECDKGGRASHKPEALTKE